jgi:Putative zinc-finger
MTLTHDDANARLLDLVYGEAPPTERQALEAHVAGCARCQADLAALGHTRARVRAALDDQPAPSAAHARILQAAAAAVAPAAAVAVRPQAAAAPPARAVVPARSLSLWERLRATWTFPTLATIGAVAVMLLASKVFLNPEQTLERGHEGLFESATPATGPAAPEPLAKAQQAEEKRAQPSGESPAPGEADRAAEAKLLRRTPPHGGSSAAAKAAAERVRALVPSIVGRDGLGAISNLSGKGTSGAGEGRGIGGLGSVGSAGGTTYGSANRGAGAARHDQPAEEAVAAKPSPRSESKAEAEAPSAAKGGGYAAPPSGWKGGRVAAATPPPPAAAAPPPAPAPVAAQAAAPAATPSPRSARPAASAPKREMAEDMLDVAPARKRRAADDEGGSAKADTARQPSASPVKKAKKEVVDQPLEGLSETASSPAPAEPAKEVAQTKDARDKEAPLSQEALTKRAEQLFTAHRWQEAIAAYRELLRRFPDADPVTRWRTRLVQAQREASAKTAPAAVSAPASAPAEAH